MQLEAQPAHDSGVVPRRKVASQEDTLVASCSPHHQSAALCQERCCDAPPCERPGYASLAPVSLRHLVQGGGLEQEEAVVWFASCTRNSARGRLCAVASFHLPKCVRRHRVSTVHLLDTNKHA